MLKHPYILTLIYNNATYYYITNLQGDVVGLLDSTGAQIAAYAYDAWGNVTVTSDNPLATLNPLTYRGYVYDWEIGLYYLQSRYYNPEWGRFINGDVCYSTGQGLLGNNMFAYCLNNPVHFRDTDGARCEINPTSLENGGVCPISSDGENMSDDLLNYLAPHLESFYSLNNVQIHISFLGRDEVIRYQHIDPFGVLLDLILAFVPVSDRIEKALNVIDLAAKLYMQVDRDYDPSGWYDIYLLTITWEEDFVWGDKITRTFYSFKFYFIWDYNTEKDPFWHYISGEDYTEEHIIYP